MLLYHDWYEAHLGRVLTIIKEGLNGGWTPDFRNRANFTQPRGRVNLKRLTLNTPRYSLDQTLSSISIRGANVLLALASNFDSDVC